MHSLCPSKIQAVGLKVTHMWCVPGLVLHPQDTWRWLETLLGDTTDIQGLEARGDADHPITHRTGPQGKTLQLQVSVVLLFRNLVLEVTAR